MDDIHVCGNKKCKHEWEKHNIIREITYGCSECESCNEFKPNDFIPNLCVCGHLDIVHKKIVIANEQRGDKKRMQMGLDPEVKKRAWRNRLETVANVLIYRLPKELRELISLLKFRYNEPTAELVGIPFSKLAMQKLSNAIQDNNTLLSLNMIGHEVDLDKRYIYENLFFGKYFFEHS